MKIGAFGAAGIFFLSGVAGAAGADSPVAPSPPAPPAPPAWANDRIARMSFDPKGDLRRSRFDRQEYSVNPEGAIEGTELLRLAAIPPRSDFVQFYLSADAAGQSPAKADWALSYLRSGRAGDPLGPFYDEKAARAEAESVFDRLSPDAVNALAEKAYAKQARLQSDGAMAELALIRIIDHEAMKMKLSLRPSDERVNFVVRSVVVRSAVETGEDCSNRAPGWVPAGLCVFEREARNACGNRYRDRDGSWLKELVPVEDTSGWSTERLYDAFVRRVGKERVSFTVDWQQEPGEIGLALEGVLKKEPQAYPAVNLVFTRLPAQAVAECVPDWDGPGPASCASAPAKPFQCPEGAEIRVDNSPAARSAVCVSKTDGAIQATLQCKKPPVSDPDSILAESVRLVTPLQQFRRQVAQKLEPTQRQYIRGVAWESMMAREYPQRSLSGASEQEVKAHGLGLSPQMWVADRSALFTDVLLSGDAAKKAAERLESIVSERQRKAMAELFAHNPGDSPITPDEQESVRAKVMALRSSLAQEVLAQLKGEFPRELAEGALTLVMRDRWIQRKGSMAPLRDCAWKPVIESESCSAKDRQAEQAIRGDLPPRSRVQAEASEYSRSGLWEKIDPCSSEAEIGRSYFGRSSGREDLGVFPIHKLTEGTDLPAGTIRYVLLRELRTAQPTSLADLDRAASAGDREAAERAAQLREELDEAIRSHIQVKDQAYLFRDLAFRLFRRNAVEILEDTSSDPGFAFPRAEADPRAMAEALFQEALFEEKTYGKIFYPLEYDAVGPEVGHSRRKAAVARVVREWFPYRVLESDLPGRETALTTLEHPELRMRVRDMDMNGFGSTMRLPNPGSKPRSCP